MCVAWLEVFLSVCRLELAFFDPSFQIIVILLLLSVIVYAIKSQLSFLNLRLLQYFGLGMLQESVMQVLLFLRKSKR
jgi:hypothetical protein